MLLCEMAVQRYTGSDWGGAWVGWAGPGRPWVGGWCWCEVWTGGPLSALSPSRLLCPWCPPRMVTCELSRVGCCLRRCQQQISTCRSQEGGESLSRAENDPRRLSQKVCGKVVLKVRPIAGERRQHHRHCSYKTRTPQRMTDCQSHRHPPPPAPPAVKENLWSKRTDAEGAREKF